MDFSNLKNDNGLYLYNTDYFVTNVGKLYFRVDSDLKSILMCKIINNMYDEDNKVLGSRSKANKKFNNLYGSSLYFSTDSVGGQFFNCLNFKYLDGSVLGDNYSNELYECFDNYLKYVNFDEDNLRISKKNTLSSIKNKLMNKDKFVDSIYYDKEINNSLISKLYMSDLDKVVEIMDSITLDDIKNFHDKFYTDKAFYRGYVVGRYSDEEYKKLRNIISYKSTMCDLDYSENIRLNDEDIEMENDSFNESIIRVNYRYTGNNAKFTNTLRMMLNNSAGLLHEILRDKYGIVYTSNSSVIKCNGLVFITAKIDKDNKEKAIDAIDEVFDLLHDEKKVKYYFEYIKSALESVINTISEDRDTFVSYIDEYLLKYGNAYDLFDYYNCICNYDPKEFIKEMDNIEKVNLFFYKGVK